MRGFGSPCTDDNVLKFMSTDDRVCTTRGLEQEKRYFCPQNSKKEDWLSNSNLDSKNMTSVETKNNLVKDNKH